MRLAFVLHLLFETAAYRLQQRDHSAKPQRKPEEPFLVGWFSGDDASGVHWNGDPGSLQENASWTDEDGGTEHQFQTVVEGFRQLQGARWRKKKGNNDTSKMTKVVTATAPGSNDTKIMRGFERFAHLHLPPIGSETPEKIPLVVDLHGFTSRKTRSWAQASRLANNMQMAILYPQGTPASFHQLIPMKKGFAWNAGACCPKGCSRQVDDVGFIVSLLNETDQHVRSFTQGRHGIDLKRVYAMGHSNGASMACRLGCQAREHFAAIGAISGNLIHKKAHIWASDPFKCPSHVRNGTGRPMPLFYFHGKEDGVIPYNGMKLMGFMPAEKFVRRAKTSNGIDADDAGTVTFRTENVTCTSYGRPEQNITFCTGEHDRHSWPNSTWMCPNHGILPPGVKMNEDTFDCNVELDASSELLKFFKRHSLP